MDLTDPWKTSLARLDIKAPSIINGELTPCIMNEGSVYLGPKTNKKKGVYYSLRGGHIFGFKSRIEADLEKPMIAFRLDKHTTCKIDENKEKSFLFLTRKNRSLALTTSSDKLISWKEKIDQCIDISNAKKASHVWELHRPSKPTPCFSCKKYTILFRQEGVLCQGCGAWVHATCKEMVMTPCDLQQKHQKNNQRYCQELSHESVNAPLRIEKRLSLATLKPFLNLEHRPIDIQHNSNPIVFNSEESASFHWEGVISTQQISTYPRDTKSARNDRLGDPIADAFALARYPDHMIAVIADGCSWGKPARNAAIDGSMAFLHHVMNVEVHSTAELGVVLMKACTEAHEKIMERESPGTATLCGGMLVKLATGNKKGGKKEGKDTGWSKMKTRGKKSECAKWAFVCVNVGDCKAILFSRKKREFSDITCGNRENLTNPSDPGGRLGPYEENGDPDLRNLQLFYSTFDDDDIIILVSDGVHDNLDPSSLDVTPQEAADVTGMGDLQDLPDSWVDVGSEEGSRIKEQYLAYLLREKVFKDVGDLQELTPRLVVARLAEECQRVTQAMRDYMEDNPSKRQPDDKALFPGKMDHVTVIAFTPIEREAAVVWSSPPEQQHKSFTLPEEALLNLNLSQDSIVYDKHKGQSVNRNLSSGDTSSRRGSSLEEPYLYDSKLLRPHLSGPIRASKDRSFSDGAKVKYAVNEKEQKKIKKEKNERRKKIFSKLDFSKQRPTPTLLVPLEEPGDEHPVLGSEDVELANFMREMQMEEYLHLFHKEKIDLEILRVTSAVELRMIGLPIGDAKRIQMAMQGAPLSCDPCLMCCQHLLLMK